MSNTTAQILSWVVGSAYAATVVTTPQAPLGELTVLIISASGGLVGGVIATLADKEPISSRGLALRMMASGVLSPVLVALPILVYDAKATVLFVGAMSGIMGVASWYVYQSIPTVVTKLVGFLTKAAGAIISSFAKGGDK